MLDENKFYERLVDTLRSQYLAEDALDNLEHDLNDLADKTGLNDTVRMYLGVRGKLRGKIDRLRVEAEMLMRHIPDSERSAIQKKIHAALMEELYSAETERRIKEIVPRLLDGAILIKNMEQYTVVENDLFGAELPDEGTEYWIIREIATDVMNMRYGIEIGVEFARMRCHIAALEHALHTHAST